MICCELVVNRSHFIECSGTSFNGFKCLQTRMVDRFFRVFVSTARVIRNAYDFRDFLKKKRTAVTRPPDHYAYLPAFTLFIRASWST